MDSLSILLELQAAHDGLKTIHRDLTTFPPEMADLDASVKATRKRIHDLDRRIEQTRAQFEASEAQHRQAAKAEAGARQELKTSAHKVQYTAAMRSLEEKERHLVAAMRAISESGTVLKTLEAERDLHATSMEENSRQFSEMHGVFLSERENQIVGKDRLTERIAELEGQLDAAAVSRFNRLLQSRGGRAVVAMVKDACTGCNTRLRTPLIYKLRAEGSVACETCQRTLYLPPQQSQ
jgi:predicted  nucleic acid-binding Zn-ribbon protein